ncbi:MAG: helix-turn-helix transcriptional regulator [SAR324 cluster bacterium]|nr:helix-turn-helix transcriptional regulator [SAR324 cluster bacterium]
MSKLNKMIREFREDIGQSVEGLALLLQLEPPEYVRLEDDWIPPDDILQRLSALFEWNYQDIKRIADNTPSSKTKNRSPEEQELDLSKVVAAETALIDSAPTPLAKMIVSARLEAKQDARGIATLLGVSADYFQEFENGLIPPDDLLRKLCSLFGWNYKQILQKLKTQSSVLLGAPQPLLPAKEIQARFPKQDLPELPEIESALSLNDQIQQARIEAGQNIEGISLLLQVNPEFYEQIESGEVLPDKELLKRISSLFGWNYHELLQREKSLQLSQLRPAVTSLDSSESTNTKKKLREVQEKIAENWQQMSREQQETLLTQLEFIHGSMENLNKQKLETS